MQWHFSPLSLHPQNFKLCATEPQGISEVVYFAFKFTFVPFGGVAENHTHSHTCLNQLSKSVTLSECSYSSRAG